MWCDESQVQISREGSIFQGRNLNKRKMLGVFDGFFFFFTILDIDFSDIQDIWVDDKDVNISIRDYFKVQVYI